MVETAEARAKRLRALRKNNPGYSSDKNKKWKENNREKYLAHKAVENALRAGKMIKQPCCKCGDEKSQAHHENYTKQLDVIWYCQKHHKERHAEIDALARIWDL